jgi:hypothetical protein
MKDKKVLFGCLPWVEYLLLLCLIMSVASECVVQIVLEMGSTQRVSTTRYSLTGACIPGTVFAFFDQETTNKTLPSPNH